MAQIINNPNGGINGGSVDGGGARPLDFGTVNQIHSPFGGKLPIEVKPTSEAVKQQNLLVGGNTLTAEDKFYEMLGIKKSSGGWGIQSRPMGRILVAIVLVAGYFAYKKFKK